MFALCDPQRSRWARLALLGLLSPSLCGAFYGGGGGGFGGGGGYEPPAPKCEPFKCPTGSKPVGEQGHQLWSYGCKDSGLNVMSMGQNFDPNDPLGSMKKGKNVDKCCVERDICKQTCGTTAKECHDQFWACSKKICKGDQNCELSAMMGSFVSDDEDRDDPADKKDPPEQYDYEKDRQKRDCRGYEKTQKQVCKCVKQDSWQKETESNLKAFYKTHNPEKLDSSGDIKDIADVWKKWKGKEPQMFQALATKYKKKAVLMKTKPKPPPYKPPPPPPPLSKEEQEKEDKRMADLRAKWAKEDAERDAENKKRDAERAERDRVRAEEREEEERRKKEEAEGETVEL